MQRDLAEHEQPDVVAFLPPINLFLWKLWAMPIQPSVHMTAESWGLDGLHVAASSIIDAALVSTESIPSSSNRLRKNYCDTVEIQWLARLKQA